MKMLGGFSQPMAEPLPPGEMRKVKLNYRWCSSPPSNSTQCDIPRGHPHCAQISGTRGLRNLKGSVKLGGGDDATEDQPKAAQQVPVTHATRDPAHVVNDDY